MNLNLHRIVCKFCQRLFITVEYLTSDGTISSKTDFSFSSDSFVGIYLFIYEKKNIFTFPNLLKISKDFKLYIFFIFIQF